MLGEASRCLSFKEMKHGLAAQRAEPILDQPHEPAILENWAKPLLPGVVRAIVLAHSLDELPPFVQQRADEQNRVDLLTMTGRCCLGAFRDRSRDRPRRIGPPSEGYQLLEGRLRPQSDELLGRAAHVPLLLRAG